MKLSKENVCGAFKKRFLFFLTFFILANGLYAQTGSSNWDVSYWVLNMGAAVSDIDVDGASFGIVLDPKLNLTPGLMIGSKNILNFSTDGIIALETQAYLRWNFLRLGNEANTTNLFFQGGMGLLGVLKGPNDASGPNKENTRASLLFDGTLGATIPLSSRWSIEPSARGGYPFIWGVAVTVGYKFPLPL